jgi:hypothetical protein
VGSRVQPHRGTHFQGFFERPYYSILHAKRMDSEMLP